MQLFAKFDDPATERDYVASELQARIPGTRFLAALGIVTLISYIGFNPMHFPVEGVLQYNMAAGPFVLLLAALIGITFTPVYVEKPWVDVIVFSTMTVVMLFLIEAPGAQAGLTDVSRLGMAVSKQSLHARHQLVISDAHR